VSDIEVNAEVLLHFALMTQTLRFAVELEPKIFFWQKPPFYHQFLLVFLQYPKYFYEIIKSCLVWLRHIAKLSLDSNFARYYGCNTVRSGVMWSC